MYEAQVEETPPTQGIAATEWRNLLKLLLDLSVRNNSAIAIDRDYLRWMGTRMSPKFILPPADLRQVVEAWPTLPEAVRAGIVELVKAAKSK